MSLTLNTKKQNISAWYKSRSDNTNVASQQMLLFVEQMKVSSFVITCVFPHGAHLLFLEFRSDVYKKRDGAVSSVILSKSTKALLWKWSAQCELQETTFPGLSLRKSRQPASCSQIPLPPSHELRVAFNSAAVKVVACK